MSPLNTTILFAASSEHQKCQNRNTATGNLIHNIARRTGNIQLNDLYNLSDWENIGNFHFIKLTAI